MDTIHIDSKNVQMVAHRGVSGLETENTASAFVAAGNRSYYGIETDVHRTADGQFVVFHDDNTQRVAGDAMVVEETTYETLRSLRLKVDHNLLAVPGSAIGDIREIFTHEQALAQCAGYLEKMNGVKVTRCENTAMAAQIVAQSGRRDVAAIASRACAEIYGLNVLEGDIQDHGNNYTRFICISRNAEIYPGANRTSVMMTLPHRPGALCEALMRIQALGVNISKLESRPIPERDFDFMFYFDLDLSVYSESFPRMIDDLNDLSEQFRYLGSYLEVV